MISSQLLRPKFFIFVTLLVCSGQYTSANPIPDNDSVSDKFENFFDRLKNTFSSETIDETKEKLSNTEIILIAVAAFLVVLFLSCCILACLCECVKEILCCICCCGRNT